MTWETMTPRERDAALRAVGWVDGGTDAGQGG